MNEIRRIRPIYSDMNNRVCCYYDKHDLYLAGWNWYSADVIIENFVKKWRINIYGLYADVLLSCSDKQCLCSIALVFCIAGLPYYNVDQILRSKVFDNCMAVLSWKEEYGHRLTVMVWLYWINFVGNTERGKWYQFGLYWYCFWHFGILFYCWEFTDIAGCTHRKESELKGRLFDRDFIFAVLTSRKTGQPNFLSTVNGLRSCCDDKMNDAADRVDYCVIVSINICTSFSPLTCTSKHLS